MNLSAGPASDREPGSGADPAWRHFWATGAVDTFGSSVAAVLAPESEKSPPLVAHWRAWMRALPHPGELLDLATGNGVVLSHLLLARPESTWRGVGVDLTQPKPDWLLAVDAPLRERIAVRGEVSAESLPFESGRFCAVTSQFGIEYAALGRAMPEAVRVLQPGGCLGWVMHHAQGRPANLAREELAHLAWLEQVEWFTTITNAIHGMDGTASPSQARSVADETSGGSAGARSPAGRGMRPELDRLGQALRARAASSTCPDLLMEVGRLTVHCLGMANRQQGASAVAQLTRFARALLENRTRLDNLVACALDGSSWEALLAQLRAQGIRMNADTGPLHDRGHLMGWWLHGHRA